MKRLPDGKGYLLRVQRSDGTWARFRIQRQDRGPVGERGRCWSVYLLADSPQPAQYLLEMSGTSGAQLANGFRTLRDAKRRALAYEGGAS